MNKGDKPKSLGDIVYGFLKQEGLLKDVQQQRVVGEWDSIVGDDIAKKTEVDRVEEGTVYVKVASDSWRNQLTMMQNELVEKINNQLYNGEQIIKSIKFIR